MINPEMRISFLIVVTIFGLTISCQRSNAPTENDSLGSANSGNIQKQLPPGFPSNAALPVNGQTPGIPANALEVEKGTTPTPGIPAPNAVQVKKGTTPTPGIPDEATLKKQLNQRITDINAVNNPSSSASNTNAAPSRTGTDKKLKPLRRLP